ncbi:hypothetical protein AcetOrient_orf01638 [Acetobacter orientalis]|uniref:Uncharacterized protein n=1 Tax=Acetobacter orientalis TaxID=146474 RepID=A0A2Z5ZFR1_9PROT|nr:hypothetical protein AcetOrient_orf01638 [Acetobacter orientalis]
MQGVLPCFFAQAQGKGMKLKIKEKDSALLKIRAEPDCL